MQGRYPGRFYTYAELNAFLQYCGERKVMAVPEIDMPGHSGYFRRAFGVDMQDDRGMTILEEILSEFMDHVDTKFLHVGPTRSVSATRGLWTICRA